MGSGASRAGPPLARPTPLLPGPDLGAPGSGTGRGAHSLTSAIFAVLTGHISAAAAAGSRPEPGCKTRQRDSSRRRHRLCRSRRRCLGGNAQEPPERAHHTPLRPLAAPGLSWTRGKRPERARAAPRQPSPGGAQRRRSQGGCGGRRAS